MNFAVCEPVSMTMFAVNSASSIFQHGQQKAAVNARNRQKLANFDAENQAYLADTILKNSSWKDQVQQSEANIDDIFRQSAEQWQQQDMQMEEVYAKHAFDTIDILKNRYKNEYAGEQTGNTAARLAGAPVREAGMALTKSVRNVIMNEDKAQLNREIIANDANRKSRQQWEQVRQSPIPGHTPRAPQYEAGPGIGGLLMNIAVSAAGAYMQGTQLNKMNKIMDQGSSGLQLAAYNANPTTAFTTSARLGSNTALMAPTANFATNFAGGGLPAGFGFSSAASGLAPIGNDILGSGLQYAQYFNR